MILSLWEGVVGGLWHRASVVSWSADENWDLVHRCVDIGMESDQI